MDPHEADPGFVDANGGQHWGFIANQHLYEAHWLPPTGFGYTDLTCSGANLAVFSLNYNFNAGNGDNGNVIGITNNRDTTRSQSFAYDALNRLTSAQNAGTNCGEKTPAGAGEYWGNTYGYDAWGNLLNKTVTKCSAENLSVTADTLNRMHSTSGSDYQYDAAGNMTVNVAGPMAPQSFTYDAENRITGTGGYTYTYDADGKRVEKSNGETGTVYWYMTPGVVAESDLSGNLQSEYVFFDGERVARKDFSGSTTTVSYYFSDHLKTASVITNSAGTITEDEDYYPWGGEIPFVNYDSNHYKFTGKERDIETQIDYFGARYYANWTGRFLSADWAEKPEAVPYSDLADPQSLNLYSYVRNIPTSDADPDDHFYENLIVPQKSGTVSEIQMPPSDCPTGAVCTGPPAFPPPQHHDFSLHSWLQGVNKEMGNIPRSINNLFCRLSLNCGPVDMQVEAKASNSDEEVGMWTAALALFFTPGGEEEEAGTVIHHIATNKNSEFTPLFEKLFAKFGLTLEDDANRMPVSKLFHNSTHPAKYHQFVLERLTQATRGKSFTAGQRALIRALNRLRDYIQDHPAILRK